MESRRPHHAGEALADHGACAVVGTRQHVGVDAQGESRVAVAEIFGEFLDGDAASEHDAGIVVAELVDAFLAGGDVAASAAPVSDRFGDHAGFTRAGFQVVSE